MFICHRDLGVVVGCAVCAEVGSQLKLEEREGWSLSDAALASGAGEDGGRYSDLVAR